ncbi:glycine cleavage system protein T [Alteromonas sp. C1M14]|uniref:CAF17-like 4Fe-4S cluster assembly/insertion protein YgfZ n=1 Tax=Alteromonas sp. C1M14 TaxID=2841567 RepID=UPI001C085DD4|nr:glycine cleavage system protein T [Alteromonas sp. C1M14]MBU2979091.1 glycine cleavage system protein T [Alteromonas sp. C1M14]
MKTLDYLSNISDSFLIPLNNLSVISVTGEQRDEYLHGQLTVDTKALTADAVRRTAHCDFKGKAWSLSLVLRHQDAIWLSLNNSSAEHTLAQLNKYGVFSKVTITQHDDALAHFALSGSEAEQWLIAHFGGLPTQPMSSVQHDTGVVIRTDYPNDVFIVILDPKGIDALKSSGLFDKVDQYPQTVYEALSIKNGIPDVSGDGVNQFVPQMMNVQALHGIDFNKGCYMGQEVVARTRYLGKNKRAGFALCFPDVIDVNVGDSIEIAVASGWRRAGTVIRCASLGNETWVMAILPNDTTPQDRVRLGKKPDIAGNFAPLPYTIE